MQRSLRLAIPELGTEDYEFISISADIGSTTTEINNYANQQGFDWTFAVASEDFLRELVSHYGRSVITTPNMVHFVMQPDGSISQMYQGAPSPAELIEQIRSATFG